MTKKILLNPYTNEQEIKKSLFIGVCFPISSAQQFFAALEHHQDLNATHNCWAYRIGNVYRFNDDGEPSGTAGKPILAAIDGAGFDEVGALVIRHYGGTKLGTGGLARAYGGTIAKNLQEAPFDYYVAKVQLLITIDFAFNQSIHQLLKQYQGDCLEQDFRATGVNHKIIIPEKNVSSFSEDLINYTKGTAIIKPLDL